MARAYDDTKRGAVLADIATGMSVSAAARKHGVGKATALGWRDQYEMPTPTEPIAGEVVPTDPTAIRPLKKADLGGQLYSYLSESIATLESQVVFARDRAWLEKQSADSLAILHGVIADKATRLLAAIQASGDGEHADNLAE